MGDLTVGVVGLGLGYHHTAAYTQDPAVGEVVVCDSDPARLEEVRRALPVSRGYLDLDQMLEEARPDAVSIVTPDHLHRPHAERCLRAGCHVLLTKPLATNLEDARAIVLRAEASGRTLMVAHERRYRSRVAALKRLLDGGELGDVIHLRIDAIQDKREQFRRSPWYASPEAGRTALVGSGIHEVDLLRYLIGRPIQSAYAFANRLGSLVFPADKTTAALFQFEGGAIGQVTVTYEAHRPSGAPPHTGFHLVATKGVVVGSRAALDAEGGWQDLPVDEREIVTGTFGCVRGFLGAIVRGEPVPIAGRDAFASLAACVAADVSAATGEPTMPAAADFGPTGR